MRRIAVKSPQKQNGVFDELIARLPELRISEHPKTRGAILVGGAILVVMLVLVAMLPSLLLAGLSSWTQTLALEWPWQWDWSGGGEGRVRISLRALIVMVILAVVGILFIALGKLAAWISPIGFLGIGGAITALGLALFGFSTVTQLIKPPMVRELVRA